MQITGIILILVVIVLFFLWLRFQRKQEQAVEQGGIQEVTVLVKGAYDPAVVTARVGVPLRLHFNRQEDTDCSRFVTFEGIKLRQDLKPFAVSDVEFTPTRAGDIPFTCDMGMYQGKVIVQ